MPACLISGIAEYKSLTTSFSTGLSFDGDLDNGKAALVGKYNERLSGRRLVRSLKLNFSFMNFICCGLSSTIPNSSLFCNQKFCGNTLVGLDNLKDLVRKF
ncbi:hypothetical protein SAMN05661012_06675 [Chitinophaga sancti]|uniref:Uncharacterized protein n=1 Tax=Chitinophaga sancti TaxID=1004 RepID=A0A1K1T411_9BACT|nr:hypothetical protein SAMN05661012_06675 [Chitinophaga sancti]